MTVVCNINCHSVLCCIISHTTKIFFYFFHLEGMNADTINGKFWESNQTIGIVGTCCNQSTGCVIQFEAELTVIQGAACQVLLSCQANLSRSCSVAVVEDYWLCCNSRFQETICSTACFNSDILAFQVEGYTTIFGVHFSDRVVIGTCTLQLNSREGNQTVRVVFSFSNCITVGIIELEGKFLVNDSTTCQILLSCNVH